MAQHLKNQLKQVLSSLNLFVTKLPRPKQVQYINEIKTVTSQKDIENEKVLTDVLKQLEYRYNFLRLTNPQITKQIEKELAEGPKDGESKDSTVDSAFAGEVQNNEMNSDSIEENKGEDSTRLKTGKYILKDGKLVEGEAPKRAHSEFSNWHASNVDPEDLKRHKELLDRQHFRGPVWNGQKPKSILDEENPLFNLDVEPEPNPNLKKPKEANFEVVKR